MRNRKIKKSIRERPRVLVIVGPTASGKSALAVYLAEKFNGEIISADSRQVYKGLDIGSGKITKREMRGVPHHLLDVASPRGTYSAARYKRDATRAVRYIVQKGKVPIVVGGTGFYIATLLEDILLPNIKPDTKLRKRLEKKSARQLFTMLSKADPKRAVVIDPHNRHRLIRALEIAKSKQKNIGSSATKYSSILEYQILKIGITPSRATLRKQIRKRLLARMRQGMVKEAKQLHQKGLSYKRMRILGLEYRYLADYLQHKLSYDKFLTTLENKTWQYAKRQMTWFKRDKRILWFSPTNVRKIEATVRKFLAD